MAQSTGHNLFQQERTISIYVTVFSNALDACKMKDTQKKEQVSQYVSPSYKLHRQYRELSATQILYSWFYPYSRCKSCQMFCFCSWSIACAFNQNFDNSQKYAHVEWNMEYENASTCTNTALIQTLHHLLCTLHQLLNLHRITTFRIHSPYRKITTATLTNLYKKIHLTAQISQVPPGRNTYGVMKTTISTIISNYCHYQSTSSGR